MSLALKELQKFDLPVSPLPLSWSQLKSIDTCILKWYFDYVMKYRKLTYTSDAAIIGKTIHTWIQRGFDDMELIDGKVDLYGNFEHEIPDEYIESLYWIEDYFQKWWTVQKANGLSFEQIKPRMELEISSSPELYNNVWFKRFGYADMVWNLPDGGYAIWDFKTGNFSQYSINAGLRQLYYYKSIFESWNLRVSSIHLMYTTHKQIVSRVDHAVARGTKNVSRFSTRSIQSIENLIKKSIDKLLTTEIVANYDDWYCTDYCSYSDPELLLCNFEENQDLSKFHHVENKEELVELAIV